MKKIIIAFVLSAMFASPVLGKGGNAVRRAMHAIRGLNEVEFRLLMDLTDDQLMAIGEISYSSHTGVYYYLSEHALRAIDGLTNDELKVLAKLSPDQKAAVKTLTKINLHALDGLTDDQLAAVTAIGNLNIRQFEDIRLLIKSLTRK